MFDWLLSYYLLFSFALEPLLPKKLHTKSQDKLDREEPERDRKEKKKEKRNSKHQEIFDKEMKTTEIPLQPAEAVILSETVLKKMTPSWNLLPYVLLFFSPSYSNSALFLSFHSFIYLNTEVNTSSMECVVDIPDSQRGN